MPEKITSKNLSYNQALPPFLAALRGEISASAETAGPDPLLAKRRRVGKPRSGSAEAEDAPVVIDEDGNVLRGVQIGRDGTVTDTGAEKTVGEEGREAAGEKEAAKDETKDREKEKVAGIGGGKKRKVGRVVGNDEEGDRGRGEAESREQKNTKEQESRTKDVKAGKDTATAGDGDAKSAGKPKKAKKIKLSFGDDGD